MSYGGSTYPNYPSANPLARRSRGLIPQAPTLYNDVPVSSGAPGGGGGGSYAGAAPSFQPTRVVASRVLPPDPGMGAPGMPTLPGYPNVPVRQGAFAPSVNSQLSIQRQRSAAAVSPTDFAPPSALHSIPLAGDAPSGGEQLGPPAPGAPVSSAPGTLGTMSGTGFNGETIVRKTRQFQDSPEKTDVDAQVAGARRHILAGDAPGVYDIQQRQGNERRADAVAGAVAQGAANSADQTKAMQAELKYYRTAHDQMSAAQVRAGWEVEKAKQGLAGTKIAADSRVKVAETSARAASSEGDKNRASREKVADMGRKPAKPAPSEQDTYLKHGESMRKILGADAPPEKIDQALAAIGIKRPTTQPSEPPAVARTGTDATGRRVQEHVDGTITYVE